MRKLTWYLLFTPLLLVFSHEANAQCSVPNDTNGTPTAGSILAQSFQATCDGNITDVTVDIASISGPITNASVYVTTGNNPAAVVVGNALTGVTLVASSTNTFDFSGLNVTVTSGSTYTIVINDNGDVNNFEVEVDGANPYLNGSFWSDVSTEVTTSDMDFSVTVNDVPAINLPGPQTTDETADIVFTGATAISIADGEPDDQSVTVAVAYTGEFRNTTNTGTLTATASGAASVLGSGTGNLTITGTLTDVNNTLDGLTYVPGSVSGIHQLTITTNDGNGGSDSQTIDIGVTGTYVLAVNTDNSGDPEVGSLRAAMVDANLVIGADIIDATGISGTINLAGDLPIITDDLAINGPGASTLDIDGGDTHSIVQNLTDDALAIADITLANGLMDGNGGAILHTSTALLTIERVHFLSNLATGNGGAISVDGNASISQSLFESNNAGSNGGAVNVLGATVSIVNSTFTSNIAESGGGLFIPSTGAADLNHVTITNNTASSSGGDGIEVNGTGAVTLNYSIVYGNGTQDVNRTGTGTFSAGNTANIIGTSAGTIIDNINVISTDPGFASLADNGGETQTIRVSGTAAINAATSSSEDDDQTGTGIRPIGSERDLGALEVSGTVPSYSVTWLDENPQDGTVDRVHINFDQPVNFGDDTPSISDFDAFSITGASFVPAVDDYTGVAFQGISQIVVDVTGAGVGTAPSDFPTLSYNESGDISIFSSTDGTTEINDTDVPTSVTDGAEPYLLSSTPNDDDTGIAIDSDIVLTFSESVVVGTGDVDVVDISFTDDRTIPIGSASFSTNQVTVDPGGDFSNLRDYAVQIDPAAIVDGNGNAFAGIPNNTTLNFTTIGLAPTYDVTWLDSDEDGNIDQLRLDFDIDVDFTDATPGDAFDAISISGGVTIISTSDFSGVDAVSDYTFNVSGVAGTATPLVTILYNQGNDNTIVADLGGLEIADASPPGTVTDAAGPVMISATTNDDDENGLINSVTITFSENIDDGLSTLGSFDVDDTGTHDYSNEITDTNDDDNNVLVISFDENAGVFDTGVTPDVIMSATSIRDADGNARSIAQTIEASDGAAPILIAAETVDDGNGEIDAVTLTFSENIDDGNSTLGGSFNVNNPLIFDYTGENPDTGTPDDNLITVSFTENTGTPDTDVTPEITVAANAISDGTNLLASQQVFNGTTDGAAPVIYDSEMQASNNYLQVVFSEPIYAASDPGVDNIDFLTDFDDTNTGTDVANSIIIDGITTLSGDPITTSEDTILFTLDVDPVIGNFNTGDFVRISTSGNTLSDLDNNLLDAGESTLNVPLNDVANTVTVLSASYESLSATSGYIEFEFTDDGVNPVGLLRDNTSNRSPQSSNTFDDGRINTSSWTNGSANCSGTSREVCIQYADGGSGITIGVDDDTDIQWTDNTGNVIENNTNYTGSIYRLYLNDISGLFTGSETYTISPVSGATIRSRANPGVTMASSYSFTFDLPDIQPPTVTASTAGSPFNSSSFTISGTVDDAVLVFVTVDGNLFPADITGSTWLANVSVDNPGTYDVFVSAFDDVGNEGSNSVQVSVLASSGAEVTTAPNQTLCVDDDYVVLSNIVIAEANANDINGSGNFLLRLPTDFAFNTSVTPIIDIGGADDFTVTPNFLGGGVLELDFTVFQTNDIDVITISGLQIESNSVQPSSDLIRIGGSANIFGLNGIDASSASFASLASQARPSSIVNAQANINTVDQGSDLTELSLLTGSTFSITPNITTASLNWYDNSLTPLSSNIPVVASDLSIDTNNPGLYTRFVTQSDGTCESDPLAFNILVYSYSDGTDDIFVDKTFTYRGTDDNDTLVFSKPVGHIVNVSGNGIVANIDEGDGFLRAVFDPSDPAVVLGNNTVSFTTTNAIGESVTVQADFEVQASSPLIDNLEVNGISITPVEDYCVSDYLSFDIDLAEMNNIIGGPWWFGRLSLFNRTTPTSLVPVAFTDQPAGGETITPIDGSAPPPPGQISDNNPPNNWGLDLSDLDVGSNYEVYAEIFNTVSGNVRYERILRFRVNPLPSVTLDFESSYCINDDSNYDIEAEVEGVVGFIGDYEIEFNNVGTWVLAHSGNQTFNPSTDLNTFGVGSGVGEYRIIYESHPFFPASCTNTDTVNFTLFPEPADPDIDPNQGTNPAGGGTVWYNTGDVENGMSSIVIEYCSPDEFFRIFADPFNNPHNFYEDDGVTPIASIGAGFIQDSDIFGGVTTTGTFDIYFARVENGCESRRRKISVYIYDDTELPSPSTTFLNSFPGDVEVEPNRFVLEYCNAFSDIIMNAPDVSGSNPTSLDPTAYYNIYAQDLTLLSTLSGTNITAADIGLVGGIDEETTIFVSQVWNDQTPGAPANLAEPFEGCESGLIQIDIKVSLDPGAPTAADFGSLNSTIVHVCEDGAVSPILTSVGDPTIDQYVWYDNDGSGGIGTEIDRINNGASITQATLEAASSFRTDVDNGPGFTGGQYSFFVTKVKNVGTETDFEGCESSPVEFIIEVHNVDEEDSVSVASTYIDSDNHVFDVEYTICLGTDFASEVLSASTTFTGPKEFQWYQSDAAANIGSAQITSPNPTLADLGLSTVTTPQTRFLLVTTRIDTDDFGPGQACESPGTHIVINFVEEEEIIFTQLSDGEDFCYDIDPATDITLDPDVDDDINPIFDIDPTRVSYTVTSTPVNTGYTGSGLPTIDLDQWHNDAGGSAVGSVTTTHTITLQYSSPTGCIGFHDISFDINPSPNIDFTFNDGDPVNDFEFCYNDAIVTLEGFDLERITRTSGGNFTISTGGIGVTLADNTVSLNPSDIHDFVYSSSPNPEFEPRSSHDITFTYSDEFGCINSITKTVFVNPLPEIVTGQIQAASTCASTDISLFVEFPTGIDISGYRFQWDAGTIEKDAFGDPTFEFAGVGSNEVQVTVTTPEGCDVFIEQSFTIGEAPIPAFSWIGITEGRDTDFTVTEDNLELNDGDVNFLELEIVGETTFSQANPTFPYTETFSFPSAGTYTVNLTMQTTSGCSETVSRQVKILDHLDNTVINADTPYNASFESGMDGWLIDSTSLDGKRDDLQFSWERGSGGPVTGSIDGSFALYTNNYLPGEVSFVYSPSLDLRGFNSPTISFLSYVQFETFRDGVVLQYSTDDGATWRNVGTFTEGIETAPNWYNDEGITSAPGTQAPGAAVGINPQQVGWADRVSDPLSGEVWLESVNTIDIPGNREFVRFRFALSAQAGVKSTIGFGFDQFRIYDRDQIVLLEQFSSTLSGASLVVDNLLGQLGSTSGSDVIRINYFTDFANSGTFIDEINQRNTKDPGAKGSFYGVEDVPSIAISGSALTFDIENDQGGISDAKLNAEVTRLNAELSIAKLEDPAFNISVSSNLNADNFIEIEANYRALFDFDQDTELAFSIAVVEPYVVLPANIGVYTAGDTIRNVLRRLLPSAAGEYRAGAIAVGETISITDMSWKVTNLLNDDSVAVIAFVQDLNSKAIYQTAATGVDLSGVDLEGVLGLGDLQDFTIYPNPADKQVTVEFSNAITEDTDWVIFDQAGREVLKGEISRGTKTMTVRTAEMPSGMYFIHLYSEDTKKQAKRVMVVH